VPAVAGLGFGCVPTRYHVAKEYLIRISAHKKTPTAFVRSIRRDRLTRSAAAPRVPAVSAHDCAWGRVIRVGALLRC
jgi:hypothetical protein